MRKIRNMPLRCLNWVRGKPILFGFLSMVLAMTIGFGILLAAVGPLNTKFAYDQETFVPMVEELCAGDTLVVPVSGTTSGERTVTSVSKSIHSGRGGMGGYLFNYPTTHIATQTNSGLFNVMSLTVLPDDIPPGYYRLILNSSQNNLHAVSGFDANFSVINCP